MNANKRKLLAESVQKAFKGLWSAFPILISVVLLISLVNVLVDAAFFAQFFGKNNALDLAVGATFGSILAGNPATSYVIGGELLGQGVSLLAVSAFLVCWVTVGVVQFPAESILLGKRFAIARNVSAFFCSIMVAVITVFLVGLL
ncbi:hypothetical protein COU37_01505 [Candidatus Micrarchaeota archaeon CG10_big_fil_rev_8_21_14_0_10_45_29]|nr:MAG: hypothetical protein COU37_01505 [Candidatus Micrarchaeota archaeon CG10_big_fil_rev_8_21_14_0_10_45_29]